MNPYSMGSGALGGMGAYGGMGSGPLAGGMGRGYGGSYMPPPTNDGPRTARPQPGRTAPITGTQEVPEMPAADTFLREKGLPHEADPRFVKRGAKRAQREVTCQCL